MIVLWSFVFLMLIQDIVNRWERKGWNQSLCLFGCWFWRCCQSVLFAAFSPQLNLSVLSWLLWFSLTWVCFLFPLFLVKGLCVSWAKLWKAWEHFEGGCTVSMKLWSSDHPLFCPQYLTLQRSLRRSGSAASSPGISHSTSQWCPGSNRTVTSSGPREGCWAALWSHRCRQSSQKGRSPSEFVLASRYSEAFTEFWFYFWWQFTFFEWRTSIFSLLCCMLSAALLVKVMKEKIPCKSQSKW